MNHNNKDVKKTTDLQRMGMNAQIKRTCCFSLSVIGGEEISVRRLPENRIMLFSRFQTIV